MKLPGTPSITITSQSTNPYLVPWTIEYQYPFINRPYKITTWSKVISEFVSSIVKESLPPCTSSMLDDPKSRLWKETFWGKIKELKDPFDLYISNNKL